FALAALFHDLGHGPLSHAWEREIVGEGCDRDTLPGRFHAPSLPRPGGPQPCRPRTGRAVGRGGAVRPGPAGGPGDGPDGVPLAAGGAGGAEAGVKGSRTAPPAVTVGTGRLLT